MRETHEFLAPFLAARGMDLVPVKTSEKSESPSGHVDPYVGSDPVLSHQFRWPEDVDVLLLLCASTAIDFGRLIRIRRERQLPVIAMIHDLMPIRHPEWFPPGADRNYRVLLQQILHVADHVVVPSAHVRDDLLDLDWSIRPAIHAIHLGSSFEQRQPRNHKASTVDLLYVSTLDPRKGHLLLIRAYDALRAAGLPITLTLVGKPGWEIDDLLDQLRNHPDLGTSLRWYRDADDALVATLLDACTVAVVPAEGEGFGLFVEEALTAGIMVVATDLPVFRERSNPNLILCDRSVEGLCTAIREASDRRPEPLAPGDVRSMRDFAEEFSSLVLAVSQPS